MRNYENHNEIRMEENEVQGRRLKIDKRFLKLQFEYGCFQLLFSSFILQQSIDRKYGKRISVTTKKKR